MTIWPRPLGGGGYRLQTIGAIIIVALAACGVEAKPPSVKKDASPSGLAGRPTAVLETKRPLDPDFKSRELTLKNLRPGESCPVSTVTREVPKVGLAVGDGPVFGVLGMSEPPPADGGVVHYKDEQGPVHEDLFAVKALWAVSGDHPESVLLRGRRLDGPGRLLFQKSEGEPVQSSLELPSGSGEWRFFPSAMFIGQEGCFGVQVDGPQLAQAIVFKAVP